MAVSLNGKNLLRSIFRRFERNLWFHIMSKASQGLEGHDFWTRALWMTLNSSSQDFKSGVGQNYFFLNDRQHQCNDGDGDDDVLKDDNDGEGETQAAAKTACWSAAHRNSGRVPV